MANLSYNLDKKVSVIFILTFTIISIIDSAIVKFIAYSGNELSTTSYVVIFSVSFIIFAIGGIILLNSVKRYSPDSIYKQSLSQRYFHGLALSTQFLTIGLTLIIILQMVFLNKYNLILLVVSTYLTHITAIIFLVFLVYIFVGWLRSKRNYTIALYMVSFILISVSIVVSAIYLEYFYSRSYSMDRKPSSLHSFIIRQEVTPFSESLTSVSDIVYLLSFLSIWVAILVLFYHYRHNVGKIIYVLL